MGGIMRSLIVFRRNWYTDIMYEDNKNKIAVRIVEESRKSGKFKLENIVEDFDDDEIMARVIKGLVPMEAEEEFYELDEMLMKIRLQENAGPTRTCIEYVRSQIEELRGEF